MLVTRSDLLSYPVAEGSTDHSSTTIHDPLFRYLLEVRLVRQIVHNVGLLHDEGADVLQGQVLVARHVVRLDLVVGQVPLLCVDDRLQEVNGHIINRRQVHVVVHGQEDVALLQKR